MLRIEILRAGKEKYQIRSTRYGVGSGKYDTYLPSKDGDEVWNDQNKF
jgi:hypothetical protein